jgi:nitroimidazol reductase NimA-like FMN-containing flavoprotein (pyridoxamine 5'-phosphate oxidase superfamily)
MTLATSVDNTPWACGLFMGLDERYNLYFMSASSTRHVRNVLRNPQVSVVVFNSHVVPGSANGVQITGRCERLSGAALPEGIEATYRRRFPDAKERARHRHMPAEFSKDDSVPGARHLYKIVPEHVYVLDKRQGEDVRTEVAWH